VEIKLMCAICEKAVERRSGPSGRIESICSGCRSELMKELCSVGFRSARPRMTVAPISQDGFAAFNR
jgi:hypothetical protein